MPAALWKGFVMDNKESMVNRVVDSLNRDLEVAFNEVIKDYDIKVYSDDSTKNPDTSLTVFVSSNTPKPKTSKKNKKLKQFDLQIAYSLYLTFDVQYLYSIGMEPIKLSMIFMHTQAEYSQMIYNRISYWSKALFKKIHALFEVYGLNLNMLPFEIYADKNNVLYISKLPTFNDLSFFDSKDVDKLLDKNAFIEKQANGLLEAATSFEHNKS